MSQFRDIKIKMFEALAVTKTTNSSGKLCGGLISFPTIFRIFWGMWVLFPSVQHQETLL